MLQKRQQKGFGLIEVIMGAAIVLIAIVGVNQTAHYAMQATKRVADSQKAGFLLSEGVEAMRLIRDDSWSTISSLTPNTTYYLFYTLAMNKWGATQTPQIIDTLFHRQFTIETVNRDGNDDITTSGGTDDPGTKKVKMLVRWNTTSGTTTREQHFFLTDL